MKKLYLIIAIEFFLGLLLVFIFLTTNKKESLFVKYVIDGDTIILSNNEKVRLIGIDSPEIYDNDKLRYDIKRLGVSENTLKKAGNLSKDFVARIAHNKKVTLVMGDERKDRYGRTLAFVYILLPCPFYEEITAIKIEDSQNKKCFKELFLNKEIIKNGYAEVYRKFDFKFKDLFLYYEREAKSKNLGIWPYLLSY